LANPAPSEKTLPPSGNTPETATPDMSKGDSVTFPHTKEHVANKQVDDSATERFANTKLNVALINDPQNGPRFTMTKRESGLAVDDGAEEPSDKVETVAGSTDAGLSSNANATPPPGEDSLLEPIAAASEALPDAASKTEVRPLGVPPAVKPPSKLPIDSSKTFVGQNGTYYDESWRWMDWRGTRRSWNWPAALSFGHWFAYRRLHLLAGLNLLWLAGLAAAAVNHVPILALALAALLITGLTGVYGNRLYFIAFRRAVDHVTKTGKGSYQERQDQLAAVGGTSATALGVMGALSITGIAAALATTLYLRGGFFLNFWPFF